MKAGSLFVKRAPKRKLKPMEHDPRTLTLIDFISRHRDEPGLKIFSENIENIQLLMENEDVLTDIEMFSNEPVGGIVMTGFCYMISNYVLKNDYFLYDDVDLCGLTERK